MDKRFFKLFNLTEEEAIAILDKSPGQLGENDSRYVAASHLASFPTEASINSLIRAVKNTESSLENRIVRRKSIESLGHLKARQALLLIYGCLADDDCYTVENAVWAIGEIGTRDTNILEEIAKLLDKPEQIYRVIIHTLAKLEYKPALYRILQFVEHDDKTIASAAIATIYRFTGNNSSMPQVVDFLQNPKVYVRRLCIQDLVNVNYYSAIPEIAICSVSPVFRLRGIRMLAEVGIADGVLAFMDIEPYLDKVIFDHPQDLNLVHEYDTTPTLEFSIRELYETDFGRCYLATQTILKNYRNIAGEALIMACTKEAYNDYGAHYHIVKLLGWLKYTPAYPILIEALYNQEPQFQKSRTAAAIALGELGQKQAISKLKDCMETTIWELKYAALISLGKLGSNSGWEMAANDQDWIIQAKVARQRATGKPIHNLINNSEFENDSR
ncbi:Bilin biosynthesis protein CpeY [Richelia intracellularis HM01]|uniref:HEAT repeat domain-containing protein n=1 Tax=Richelia intracellularis TaxID=1164990 RepID=UPI0002B566C4|nr:HEAT repeat domain-containing protein [Richelia intracellularis]CCH65886.1 Bilin biosynthesis protein CpeY [Richelia intracellularis HM01]